MNQRGKELQLGRPSHFGGGMAKVSRSKAVRSERRAKKPPSPRASTVHRGLNWAGAGHTLRTVFTYWMEPLLKAASPRTIVEIGAASGASTVQLLEVASQLDGVVHSIDPSPDSQFDLDDLKRRYGDRFVFHSEMSLDALDRIDEMDAVFIDGDHNCYTVYNELKLLERMAAEQKRLFPLTLMHDVDWPYGRRDLYYNP
jgi:predicted O-methyltransferase YrrM